MRRLRYHHNRLGAVAEAAPKKIKKALGTARRRRCQGFESQSGIYAQRAQIGSRLFLHFALTMNTVNTTREDAKAIYLPLLLFAVALQPTFCWSSNPQP